MIAGLCQGALILAGWALLCWAFLFWRLGGCLAYDEGDPYGDEVARFRRELHDWDREGR